MKEIPIEDAIIINPHVLQKFMRQGKSFANLLALYTFYLYHAKEQKTNQPLATDEFTRKGMNWALERVKKTKRLLKEMKLIEVVQKEQYSYIHLFFIYTKKKIVELFGNKETTKSTETVALAPKKDKPLLPKEKSLFEKRLISYNISSTKILTIKKTIYSIKNFEKYKFNTLILAEWINYCEKFSLVYSKNNLEHWIQKLDNKSQEEQIFAIEKAIQKGWKNFYFSKKENKSTSKVKEMILGVVKRF